MAEHRGGLGADQLQDGAGALGLAQRGELSGELPGGGRAPLGGAHQLAEQRRQHAQGGQGRRARSGPRPIASESAAIGPQRGVEQLKALLGLQGEDPDRRHPLGVVPRLSEAPIPCPAQSPQAIEVAGSPAALRRSASASQKALAAA